MATLNTCAPTCPSQCIQSIGFLLGESERTKALVLAALFLLNAALVHLILWSNHWSMYAVMLVPNCAHFMYVKYRKTHAFFSPAHLNLHKLQWDINMSLQRLKMNGANYAHNGAMDAKGHHTGSVADVAYTNGHFNDPLVDTSYYLHRANPLFMSAVSASTTFFFGPSGGTRSDMGSPGLMGQEPMRNDM